RPFAGRILQADCGWTAHAIQRPRAVSRLIPIALTIRGPPAKSAKATGNAAAGPGLSTCRMPVVCRESDNLLDAGAGRAIYNPSTQKLATMHRRLLISATLALALAVPAFSAPQDQDPKPRPDLVRGPYSKADVEFMQGMIPHHAQAVVMARMAKTHGAREDVRILCERIMVAQGDEITFMRNWLRDRGQIVPPADATNHKHGINGVVHDMLMPGMLTPEELAALGQARGPEWDRLFLAGMIKHHEGALMVVDDL